MSLRASDYNKSKPTIVRDIIYSDLALSFLPFGSTVSDGANIYDIRPVVDIDAIKNSIKNLVLINPGEIPFHPEIGSGVTALLFDPADQFTILNIKSEIARVIRTYEKRVDILDVDVIDASDSNRYHITISYTIKANGYETAVSFYLNRLR